MSQLNAIIRVSADVPIFDQDGQKIGKVAEVRGNAFKVQTGLLQKDYWLDGAVIASAVSGDAVMLSVSKSDLATHKVGEPTKAA